MQNLTFRILFACIWFDEYNYHDSLHARLIEGTGHYAGPGLYRPIILRQSDQRTVTLKILPQGYNILYS